MTASTGGTEMAMFPLGIVMFPTMVVPLHVFEPRYRQMTRDCLDSTREFGVVLIERGSEVGGGDIRTDVGTVATILDARELPDGRWRLMAGGVRRIRVARWLDDDPYPRAEVHDWPEHVGDGSSVGVDTDELNRVTGVWRRVLALQAELGDPGPPATYELSEQPNTVLWQLSGLSPLGSLDRQRLLTAGNATERLGLLAGLLTDVEETLRARMELG